MKKLLITAAIAVLGLIIFLQYWFRPSETGVKTSGVAGVVTIGPTCPVERIPPEPQCAPKMYQTTIEISQSGTILKRIDTDTQGVFRVELTPGSYEFTPKGGSPFPSCRPATITVLPNAFTETNPSCDTGIR